MCTNSKRIVRSFIELDKADLVKWETLLCRLALNHHENEPRALAEASWFCSERRATLEAVRRGAYSTKDSV